jgi:TP901-1 family phage major tail protein
MTVWAGAINGTKVGLYVNATLIAYAKNATISRSVNMIDTTTKTSAGVQNVLPGLSSWSCSIDGLVAYDSAYNAEFLDGLVTGRTVCALKFRPDGSAGNALNAQWTGNAYIDSIEITAPMEDAMTFSASFTGNGALTLSNIT